MATRCNIAIILKPEDINRPLNFVDHVHEHEIDLKMLVCSSARDSKSESLRSIYSNIVCNRDNKALQIYSHWDGYPEGVGAELVKNFNSYEKALALILAGDTSGVYDEATHAYSLGVGEEYEDCKPEQLPEPKLSGWCEYLYIFEDGEWKLGNRRISLAEYLENPSNFYID